MGLGALVCAWPASFGQSVLRTAVRLPRQRPQGHARRVGTWLFSFGQSVCALPCACLGIAPGRMLGGLALGFAASATAPHALVSVFLGIASRRRLGGVAPPRDAILLVRAKRMQKRAKGRSPLWHPHWGGVDGLRCLYRFSQVPSAPARESLRENFVGPTRSTRAAVPPYGGIPSGNARTHSAVPRLP